MTRAKRVGPIARFAVLATMTLAVVPVSALAGGGVLAAALETPPPLNATAGDTWDARFTLLAHGRVPAQNLRPVVQVERHGASEPDRFRATEVGPGVYEANVRFERDGLWELTVFEHPNRNSVAGAHTFGDVVVAAGETERTGPSSGGLSAPGALGVALVLALLAGGAAWLLQGALRRRRAPGTG